MDTYSRFGSQPVYRADTTIRRVNYAEGWRRIAIVAVGAAIGGFVVWPLIRPVFINDTPASFAGPFAPRTPDGRPNNHSGITPYDYPQDGRGTASARYPTQGNGSWNAGPDQPRQLCSYDGRRLLCEQGRR
jgi:hypothetical protein